MASTTLNENLSIKGLDNIGATLELKPLALNTKSELAVTQPIVTNSTGKNDLTGKFGTDSTAKLTLAVEPLRFDSDQKTAIDVKPLVVDACQTLKLAPLPATCIEQPYTHNIAFSLFGFEFWSLKLKGESGTDIHSPDRRRYHSAYINHGDGTGEKHSAPLASDRSDAGLRVRVGKKPEASS